jgi:hypothetical protein
MKVRRNDIANLLLRQPSSSPGSRSSQSSAGSALHRTDQRTSDRRVRPQRSGLNDRDLRHQGPRQRDRPETSCGLWLLHEQLAANLNDRALDADRCPVEVDVRLAQAHQLPPAQRTECRQQDQSPVAFRRRIGRTRPLGSAPPQPATSTPSTMLPNISPIQKSLPASKPPTACLAAWPAGRCRGCRAFRTALPPTPTGDHPGRPITPGRSTRRPDPPQCQRGAGLGARSPAGRADRRCASVAGKKG